MKILLYLIAFLTLIKCIKSVKSSKVKIELSKPVFALVKLPSSSSMEEHGESPASEVSDEQVLQYELEPERASVSDGSVLSRESRGSHRNSGTGKHSTRSRVLSSRSDAGEESNSRPSGKKESDRNSHRENRSFHGKNASVVSGSEAEDADYESVLAPRDISSEPSEVSGLYETKRSSGHDTPHSTKRESVYNDDSASPSDVEPVVLKSRSIRSHTPSRHSAGSRPKSHNEDSASPSADELAVRKSRSNRSHTPSRHSAGNRQKSRNDDSASCTEDEHSSRRHRSRRSHTPSRDLVKTRPKSFDKRGPSSETSNYYRKRGIDTNINDQICKYDVDSEAPADGMHRAESSYCIPITPGLRMTMVGPEPLEYSQNKEKMEYLYGLYRDAMTTNVKRFQLAKYLDREMLCRALLTTRWFRSREYYVWPGQMNDAVAIMLQNYGRGHGLVSGKVLPRFVHPKLRPRHEKFIVCPYVKLKMDHLYRFYASPSRHDQTYYIFSKAPQRITDTPPQQADPNGQNGQKGPKIVIPLRVNLQAHVRFDQYLLDEIKDITSGKLSPV